MKSTDIAVFTDLDGTLLDHQSYSYAAANEALEALANLHIPLILASSKTSAEIAAIQRKLNLGRVPAIVENGAGLYWPQGDAQHVMQTSQPGQNDNDLACEDDEASAYRRLLGILAEQPASLRQCFVGFSDCSAEQIASLTGLELADAKLASRRCFSEPGLWHGDQAALEEFIRRLGDEGVSARQGGRFLTLSFGASKSDRMQDVMKKLDKTTAIALGDAPNDKEMLEAADIGIIIRNDHGSTLPTLKGEKEGYIRRSELPGPAGWNSAILEILASVENTKEDA